MKLRLISLMLAASFIVVGCSEEASLFQGRRQNEEMGRRSQLEQLKADAEPTEIPTPEPTPEPQRDKWSDIIYTPHGRYRVEFGNAKKEDSILIYQTVENVEEYEDIIWLMPSGVIIVTEKYQHKVKRMAP